MKVDEVHLRASSPLTPYGRPSESTTRYEQIHEEPEDSAVVHIKPELPIFESTIPIKELLIDSPRMILDESIYDETSPTLQNTLPHQFRKIDLSTINPVEEKSNSIIEPAYLQLDSTNTFSQSMTVNLDFKPRPGNGLDFEIYQIIMTHKFSFPILPIKDAMYLIGPNRYSCVLRGEVPMVRVGGGF